MPTERDISQWYDDRHNAKQEAAWRPFEAYPTFLEQLDVQPGHKLLDIGCGTGHLLKAAHERNVETFGIDISEAGASIARRVSPASIISVGRGEELPFDTGSFDYLTCIGVLEHFLDIERGLREMVRVAKPSARLCIVVPNSDFLYWKIRGAPGTEQQDINETLQTRSEWKDVFGRCGLAVLRVTHDTWLRDRVRPLATRNPLKVIARSVVKAGWWLLPLNLTYQFVFILKPLD